MAETAKVLFADNTTTVHVKLSPDPVKDPVSGQEVFATESKVLAPGDFVSVDEVPPYMLEKATKGEAPHLTVMTEKKAQEVSQKAALLRTAAGDSGVTQNLSVQLANDTSPEESDAK